MSAFFTLTDCGTPKFKVQSFPTLEEARRYFENSKPFGDAMLIEVLDASFFVTEEELAKALASGDLLH